VICHTLVGIILGSSKLIVNGKKIGSPVVGKTCHRIVSSSRGSIGSRAQSGHGAPLIPLSFARYKFVTYMPILTYGLRSLIWQWHSLGGSHGMAHNSITYRLHVTSFDTSKFWQTSLDPILQNPSFESFHVPPYPNFTPDQSRA